MTNTFHRLALAASLGLFTLQACTVPLTPGSYTAAHSAKRLVNPENAFTRALAAKPAAYVGGYVIFGAPVEGATVALLDPAGKPLGITGKTGKFGIFGLHGSNLPKDFTIVATGGTVSGEPFTGELRQDVTNLSALNQFSHLSVATTLASLYRQNARQNVTPAVAEGDAHRFLGLQSIITPGQFDRHFDAAAFLRAANAAGGLNTFLRTVAPDIVDPRKSRRFVAFKTNQAASSGWSATSIATDLGKGALGAVGGMILGDALRLIGIGGPTMGQLKSELDALSASLADLHTDVMNLQAALQVDTTNSDYQSAMTTIETLTSAVDTAHLAQARMAAYKAGTTASASDVEASVKAQMQTFELAMNTITPGGLQLWKKYIMGDGPGVTGLVVKYGRFVTANSRLWGPTQAQLMDTFFDWVDAYQAATASLLVSNNPGATQYAADVYNDLQTYRTQEIAIMRGNWRRSLSLVTPGTNGVPLRDVPFPNYLADGMICDTRTNTLWTAGPSQNPAGVILTLRQGTPSDPGRYSIVQLAAIDPRDIYEAAKTLIQVTGGDSVWTDPSADELVSMFGNLPALTKAGWNPASGMDGVSTLSLLADDMRLMALPGTTLYKDNFTDIWALPIAPAGQTSYASKAILTVKKALVTNPQGSYWYP